MQTHLLDTGACDGVLHCPPDPRPRPWLSLRLGRRNISPVAQLLGPLVGGRRAPSQSMFCETQSGPGKAEWAGGILVHAGEAGRQQPQPAWGAAHLSALSQGPAGLPLDPLQLLAATLKSTWVRAASEVVQRRAVICPLSSPRSHLWRQIWRQISASRSLGCGLQGSSWDGHETTPWP